MKTTLTIDIGTTRTKLCLFDEAGSLRAVEKTPTPVTTDGWGSIYAVEALIATIVSFTASLDPGERALIECIAVAGVGESGGLVGPDLALVSPMILWHDHRGAERLARLSDAERAELYAITGLPANANYSLSKVAWALSQVEDEPVVARGARWLNISEYVAAWLSGRRRAEYSLASRTMALDLTTQEWSRRACELLGVDPQVFPELGRASQGEPIRAAVSQELGLDRSVLVHVVGHDHMVGAVGAGLERGELLNSTGTTEGLLLLRDLPAVDADTAQTKLANGIACDDPGYTLFASIPTGGSAFQTLQQMLDLSAPTLTARIHAISERYLAGAIDLSAMPVVVPHFRGSPPPEKSATATGTIANVRGDTTADDVIFGCFLGMATQFDRVLELFAFEPAVVKVIGPASQNPLWLHLKADLLGVDLSVSEFDEVVSRGAQALTSGARGDWVTCQPWTVRSDPDRHAQLSRWVADLAPTMRQLLEIS